MRAVNRSLSVLAVVWAALALLVMATLTAEPEARPREPEQVTQPSLPAGDSSPRE
jgi:hypothetical protein